MGGEAGVIITDTEEEQFDTIEAVAPLAKNETCSLPQVAGVDESSTFFKASEMHRDEEENGGDNNKTLSSRKSAVNASGDAYSCQSADLDENRSNLSRRSASPIPDSQCRRLKE